MVTVPGEGHRHGGAPMGVSGRKVKVPVELVNNHTIALIVLICQKLLFFSVDTRATHSTGLVSYDLSLNSF